MEKVESLGNRICFSSTTRNQLRLTYLNFVDVIKLTGIVGGLGWVVLML